MEEQELAGEQIAGLEKVNAWAAYLSLLGLAVIAPLFQFQMVTGPMVNAILFIATVVLGWRKAISIAFLPSILAFAVGLLPTVLGPMIPFIMLSNMVLVMVFHNLWRRNYWLGVGVASVAKFILLFVVSQFLFQIIFQQKLAQAVAATMSWPQLYSALIGGVIAYIFLKMVKRI